MLLWRTKMALLKSVTTCLRLLRSSCRVLLGSTKSAVHHKPVRWTNSLYTGVTSVAVGGGLLCAVPFKQAEKLSHDTLIKRAASLVTDSSSTFLSQTTLALTEAIVEYSKAVHTLIALQRRYLDSLGKLTASEEDTVWQVIIGQRTEVNERREECKRFQESWLSAVKLCEMASEAAYISGAEHAAVTAKTNVHLAQTQVEQAQKMSADADKKLAKAKVMEVQRMTQYATSIQSDEEDVPEAYLRED